MQNEAHTPTPWRVHPRDETAVVGPHLEPIAQALAVSIGTPEAALEANAAFICQAVNAHEALVQAAKFALNLLDELETGGAENFAEQEALRAALKLAKGE